MTQFGYTMTTEQAGPQELVNHVVRAEEVGFDFFVTSDRYFPWLEEQGHAPYAWSVLGAAAQATSRIPVMTYVTCPSCPRRWHIYRIHEPSWCAAPAAGRSQGGGLRCCGRLPLLHGDRRMD
jgi:hypothetical protein